jgi:16S rRNA processing protein RimM
MEKRKHLECGKIINTHGVKGALKLESWCNTPEDLAALERVFISLPGGMKEFKILKASIFKQFVIAELDGINDFDTAVSMKNKTVYAAREDFTLEEGDYFIADLIGLEVIDANTGKVYGKLKEIINRGASDIYVVDTEGGERMMPAVEEFVKEVNPEKGIFVSPIEGMFD